MLSIQRVSPKLIVVRASGQLITADVEQAVPVIMDIVQEQGVKVHALADLTGLEGWSGVRIPASLYDLQPRMLSNLLSRIAVVVDPALEARITGAARYLPAADVRVFAPGQEQEARQWLEDAL